MEAWYDFRLEQIQLGVISKPHGASDFSGGAVCLTCSLATTRVDAMAMSSKSRPRKIPFGWSIFFNVLDYLLIIYIQQANHERRIL